MGEQLRGGELVVKVLEESERGQYSGVPGRTDFILSPILF